VAGVAVAVGVVVGVVAGVVAGVGVAVAVGVLITNGTGECLALTHTLREGYIAKLGRFSAV